MKVSQVWDVISHGLDSSIWELSLTAYLNKFLRYLAILSLDLVCSEQICSLTIFVHGLAENKSHKYHLIYCKKFVFIYDFVTS